jgi:hypothetical protein
MIIGIAQRLTCVIQILYEVHRFLERSDELGRRWRDEILVDFRAPFQCG